MQRAAAAAAGKTDRRAVGGNCLSRNERRWRDDRCSVSSDSETLWCFCLLVETTWFFAKKRVNGPQK